jgi:hypothetical protein
MSTAAEQPKKQMNDQPGHKKKPFHPFKKPEEKPGSLPILKYGKGNNYFKFSQALAEIAIKEYGNLGELIELEKYYIPQLDLPDYTATGRDEVSQQPDYADWHAKKDPEKLW